MVKVAIIAASYFRRVKLVLALECSIIHDRIKFLVFKENNFKKISLEI